MLKVMQVIFYILLKQLLKIFLAFFDVAHELFVSAAFHSAFLEQPVILLFGE